MRGEDTGQKRRAGVVCWHKAPSKPFHARRAGFSHPHRRAIVDIEE
ncbi:Protein of unknown function [Pyronema omphalodes CBS 100304]|uniref:Uncharacterized protein n=1 Tax=Pyronema omphalodes (strain CBS 100304) TaxID=1076935 RepID=U4KWH7_PYROM|nr:Protein of unknown function [Pyronema omphalodes CBS 100304]